MLCHLSKGHPYRELSRSAAAYERKTWLMIEERFCQGGISNWSISFDRDARCKSRNVRLSAKWLIDRVNKSGFALNLILGARIE